MQQLLLRGSHECCSREHFHMKRRTTRRAKEHKEWNRTWHLRRRHPEILRYKCVVGFAARMIPANWTFGWFQFPWFQKEKLCERLKIFFGSSHQMFVFCDWKHFFGPIWTVLCSKSQGIALWFWPKTFSHWEGVSIFPELAVQVEVIKYCWTAKITLGPRHQPCEPLLQFLSNLYKWAVCNNNGMAAKPS